jgi:hypothetical protein
VSTLRYPCKGNYRRCPIYQRYAAARPPATPLEIEEKPPQPPAPKPAPVEEKTREEERREAPRPETPVAPAQRGARLFRPSKSLCDSLVLASLTVAAQPLGIARGKLEDVLESARQYLEEGSLIFILGDIDGYRMRVLFAGNFATYSFERGGTPICGDEAENIFEEVKDSVFDGIYYKVKLSDIPLWKDAILEELGIS